MRVSGLAFKWLSGGLPGRYEQNDVDQHGKGDAQYHAHQEPEQAPFSHPLNAFHAVSHDLGAIFISNTTSSKTASR